MSGLHPASLTAFARAAVRINELEQLEPGPALMTGLVALQGMPMGSAVAVRASVLWSRLIAHCEAQAMVSTAEAVTGADLSALAGPLDAVRIIGEELAALVHLPAGGAVDKVALGEQVGHGLPLTWEALNRGQVTLRHASKLADVLTGCSRQLSQLVEGRLIPLAVARGWTPQRLANEAARAVIALDPDGAADRADEAKQAADVQLYPGRDETASLVADGDAATLTRIMAAIDARAGQPGRDGADVPVGRRRFNALADLVLGEDQATRPTVETVITIDLTTWLGLTQRPGELTGYGPISPATARELARDSQVRRMLTDPITGHTLDLGRDRYRPSAALRRFIQVRDRVCQFPGCEQPARRCDLDHIAEWDRYGETRPDNLQALCRRHHTLKTCKLWHVDHHPDGTETWTSALGFTHVRRREDIPVELLKPPEESSWPEPVVDWPPEPAVAPYPAGQVDDPLPEPPPITLEEYLAYVDHADRRDYYAANGHYDEWYRDNPRFDLAT